MSKEYYEITFASKGESFTDVWCAKEYTFTASSSEKAIDSSHELLKVIRSQARKRNERVIFCSLFRTHGSELKSHICYHNDVFKPKNREILEKLGMLV